jgi:hypothetical protein
LEAAIEDLKNHSDSFCRDLGATIQSRFNSDLIVYDPNTPYYGYVYTGGSVIYLGPSAWDPGEMANTLAHEESHLSLSFEDLNNGAPNDAYAAGYRCAGSN